MHNVYTNIFQKLLTGGLAMYCLLYVLPELFNQRRNLGCFYQAWKSV